VSHHSSVSHCLYVANRVQQFGPGSKNGIHFLFKEMDNER